MTLRQLLTLAEQHRIAHRAGQQQQPEPEPADGTSLLAFAGMRRT